MLPRRMRGFSLLETLAAMLLLALCFGALMKAAGASMALNARAADYTQASLWASGLLDRTDVTEFPTAGVHEGRFDDRFRWRMNVSSPASEALLKTTSPMRLHRIELTVEWDEGGRPANVRFVTQRAVSEVPPSGPPPSPGGDG